jgi:phospholipid N-methyltransferase
MTLNDTAKNYRVAVDSYETGRPSYPAALVEALPLAEARLIVDLGAGTGKFTRLMLPHITADARIVAIEPVVEMSARLVTVPSVSVANRSAYDTGLPDGAADIVCLRAGFPLVR